MRGGWSMSVDPTCAESEWSRAYIDERLDYIKDVSFPIVQYSYCMEEYPTYLYCCISEKRRQPSIT